MDKLFTKHTDIFGKCASPVDMEEFRNSDKQLIDVNRLAHDKVSANYDRIHVEIFNPTEQRRIATVLSQAFSLITTDGHMKKALDFGAGTGNLTRHLLDLNATVTAADLSQGCLNQLKINLGAAAKLQTLLLNGEDISDVENESFDLVSAYSVLHHVPDYLKIVREFVRIAKLGGIIYIDHEVGPSYWEENDEYLSYLKELGNGFAAAHLFELGIPSTYHTNMAWLNIPVTFFKKIFVRILNLSRNRPSSEVTDYGDIHVNRHDHIEWEDIKNMLEPYCEVLLESDYLVCRERSERPLVWERWREKCVDMRFIIARKIRNYQ